MTSETALVPRFTIVIPTVNRASLVRRALDSALAQTYPDLEIIVSNNGSTDETRAVLDRYEGSPRLRIFHRDETIPANPHGNFLLEQSRGEFFLGLSDDDWLEPTFAEKVVALYDRNPEVSFVWTGCWMHYADVAVPAATGPEVETAADFLAGFLANRRNICWCACVTRTRDLRRIGPIPTEVICGDLFYWTKLAAFGPVGCVSEPVSHYVCYRDGGDGIAGGAPVLAWGREMEHWASDIERVAEHFVASPSDSAVLRRLASRFVSRSTANQFLWNALRGVSRASLALDLRRAVKFVPPYDPSPWIRVFASLAAPRRVLRQRVLAEARRRVKRVSPAPARKLLQ